MVTGRPCPACGAGDFHAYREVDSWIRKVPDGLDRAKHVRVRIERCGCGLFRTVPLSDERTADELYATDSICFEASVSKVRLAAETTVSSTDERHAISIPPPAKLLDVGCGAGQWLLRATCAGYRATGIDLDPRAVAFARDDLGLDAREMPLEKLPAENRFDVITLFGILEHVEEPVALLRAARERLTPGGEIVIGVPNTASLHRVVSRLGPHDWDMFLEPGHLYHYDASTLSKVAARAGLRRVRWHTATIRIRGKIPWMPVRIPSIERRIQEATTASRPAMAAYTAGLRALDALRAGDTVFATFRPEA